MDDDDDVLLTTVDNPWNPWDSYDEWYAYDSAKGHNTLSLLARITNINLDLPDSVRDFAIRQAMKEIVELNVSGMHTFAYRPAA